MAEGKAIDRRLRALEAQPAASQADRNRVTPAEWLHWRTTREQPKRWLGNAAIQSAVQIMQQRSEAVDRMLADWENESEH